MFLGKFTNLRFGQVAQRKDGAGEAALRYGREKVALILATIRGAKKLRTAMGSVRP